MKLIFCNINYFQGFIILQALIKGTLWLPGEKFSCVTKTLKK